MKTVKEMVKEDREKRIRKNNSYFDYLRNIDFTHDVIEFFDIYRIPLTEKEFEKYEKEKEREHT